VGAVVDAAALALAVALAAHEKEQTHPKQRD
jgi:hypothetical protein